MVKNLLQFGNMDSRLQNLRTLLKQQSVDAALITSVPQITYLTGYAGFLAEERDAYLLITQNNAYILTNQLYTQEIKQSVPTMTLIEMTRDKPWMKSLQNLIQQHKIHELGIEIHNLTASEYIQMRKSTLLKELDLEYLRVIKTNDEITSPAKASAISDDAFSFVLPHLKSGITEKEVAYLLDLSMKRQKADPAFRAIVAFGKNAAVPHHLSSDTTLQPNDCILFDFGAKIDTYCADMARTVFLGHPSIEQKKVYQVVLEAQQKAINLIQEKLAHNQSVKCDAIDEIARQHIIDHGYPSFPHRLGHGVGLEVHETPGIYPQSSDRLENGMVFTLEPGVYLSGSFGVRIEDMFTIQNNELIQLTKSSRELIEL